MSLDKEHFYSNLHVNRLSLSELLLNEDLFANIPNDWYVILTDIKSSTKAVLSGSHENVNLIATGSIVTVLNIAFKANILIPFFFGGDGATFIVPPSIVSQAMNALSIYRDNTLSNFNLELRTGILSVKEIYANNHQLKISKYSNTGNFIIPVVLGDGLNFAEKVIKGDDYLFSNEAIDNEELDLSGMQCRWDKIAPPENSEEVVTLIVVAKSCHEQAFVFSSVVKYIDKIYGLPEKRQPISIPKLIFKTSFNNLGREMRNRIGKINFLELVKTWMINLYGSIYFRTDSGKNYLKKLVEMSDTLVMDGRINTVITGTKKQRFALEKALDGMEKHGQIYYGLHVSNASVMSCYVRDLEDDHIHFIDGAEGGYTKAAKVLKKKLT